MLDGVLLWNIIWNAKRRWCWRWSRLGGTLRCSLRLSWWRFRHGIGFFCCPLSPETPPLCLLFSVSALIFLRLLLVIPIELVEHVLGK